MRGLCPDCKQTGASKVRGISWAAALRQQPRRFGRSATSCLPAAAQKTQKLPCTRYAIPHLEGVRSEPLATLAEPSQERNTTGVSVNQLEDVLLDCQSQTINTTAPRALLSELL